MFPIANHNGLAIVSQFTTSSNGERHGGTFIVQRNYGSTELPFLRGRNKTTAPDECTRVHPSTRKTRDITSPFSRSLFDNDFVLCTSYL